MFPPKVEVNKMKHFGLGKIFALNRFFLFNFLGTFCLPSCFNFLNQHNSWFLYSTWPTYFKEKINLFRRVIFIKFRVQKPICWKSSSSGKKISLRYIFSFQNWQKRCDRKSVGAWLVYICIYWKIGSPTTAMSVHWPKGEKKDKKDKKKDKK